jgi:hypothetical protein
VAYEVLTAGVTLSFIPSNVMIAKEIWKIPRELNTQRVVSPHALSVSWGSLYVPS